MDAAVWLEITGWAGSAILVWSLLQTRILRLRLYNLVGCFVLLAYNAIISVWPMVGLNAVLALINIVYLTRLLRTRHDAASYDILEVSADDAYTRHFLRSHAADIAQFAPALDAQVLAAEGRIAERRVASGPTVAPTATAGDPEPRLFLVVRGTETVGVVGLRAPDAETAVVVLDYVTERYRDFTPGEFVFRRSGLLQREGFRRVEVPVALAAGYYERIGFRPDGAGLALTLTPAAT